MSDLISRNAAIVQLSHNKIGDDDCDVIIQRDIETIKALASAKKKQRQDIGNLVHSGTQTIVLIVITRVRRKVIIAQIAEQSWTENPREKK